MNDINLTSPPKPRRIVLPRSFAEKNLPSLQENLAEDGYTIVGYNLNTNPPLAYAQEVRPAEAVAIRGICRVLGDRVKPWDMWVEFHWTVDEGARRIDHVVIKRSPIRDMTREQREAKWYEVIIQAIPCGNNGWVVEDQDTMFGYVKLHYGAERALPSEVPMKELLSYCRDQGEWNRIIVGKDENGEPAGANLRDGPHELVVGPTGSGKTTFLRQIAATALANGHAVMLIDEIKSGVDFSRIFDWLSATAFTYDAASTLMAQVYAELSRRKKVLISEQVGFWKDVPDDVRETERIVPIMLIIDEVTSLLEPVANPKGLKNADPDAFEENEQINVAKAMIHHYLGKLAREARFVGIHLAIAMQRPDAAILSGELRQNLTSGYLLVNPKSAPETPTIGMVFPGTGDQAASVVKVLGNGEPGLALFASEGSDVSGLKFGYAPETEVPLILEELGVPRAKPWWSAPEDDDQANVGTESEVTLDEDGLPIAPGLFGA
ncbi:FtsK/SpoIIIE domain-containing protein [Paramicrobacterium fandaimingii]|uniref:FtsK/SpoIIIE domain-containing protein n=1 Tax=Paramicrobacterium fandaimingii TaxID=2708079 RepID=UPI001420D7E0|nr:FtsK/SpoIIIE domain-containing protein [Microbacterium fandaimingii]